MPYTDFTLESVETAFGLLAEVADLFPTLAPVAVPAWLPDFLQRGRAAAALVSEKARSEFLVTPILLAGREIAGGEIAIYSGQRLDPDPGRGLSGECDYILARGAPIPRLRAPLVTILEAKRGDIELGLGQCVAQMVGARVFNEQAGARVHDLFGVVTTGEAWQFLRLVDNRVLLHSTRFYIDNLPAILAAFAAILDPARLQ